ncbi:MAG: PAS domain S-box protein, partial [Nitrospirae bacterium]
MPKLFILLLIAALSFVIISNMKLGKYLKPLLAFLLLYILVLMPFYLSVKSSIIHSMQRDILALEEGKIDYLDTVQHMYHAIDRSVVIYLLVGLCLSVLFSYLLIRRYDRPLKNLIKAAEEIKRGNLDVQVDDHKNEEFAQFIDMFNDMVRSLKDKNEELKKKDLYVNTMMDGLWVVDANDRIVDVNPAFLNMFGYSRQEVIGASLYDFFDQKNRQIVREELETKRLKGEHSTYQVEILARDGSHVPVL